MSEEMKLLHALCDALGFQVLTEVELINTNYCAEAIRVTDYKLIKKEVNSGDRNYSILAKTDAIIKEG